MDKIVVRNTVLQRSKTISNFINMTADIEFYDKEKFISNYGFMRVMLDLFNENVLEDSLDKTVLYKKYIEANDTEKDNELFTIMFKLKDDLAVKLTEHINLYHLVEKVTIGGEEIVPWYYVDSKLYIADTWWETDEDIIYDLYNLPFIEFLSKYKAY